jgi:long-subunit fatty acid transport protein
MRSPPLLCALCVASIHPAYAVDGKLTLAVGLDYSTGAYGESSDTETWAAPIALKYRTDDWNLRLATSWLHVTGPGNLTPEGEPLEGSSAVTTEQGAGDIIAALTYTVLDERNYPFGLDLGARIKFGTADAAKSLGTGKNDYALQAEVFKPIDAWMPYVSLGYKWEGDPAGINYNNVWYGSAGADYRFSQTLSAGGGYDWRQKLTPTSSAVSEASLYLNYHLNDGDKFDLYLVGGFSDASPDWGSGLIFTHRF